MAVQSTQSARQGNQHPPNTPQSTNDTYFPPGDAARFDNAPPVWSETETDSDHTAESPELLRWRADVLLDEMMLGAVDASANGSSPYAAPNGPAASNGMNGHGAAHVTQSDRRDNDVADEHAAHGYHEPSVTRNGVNDGYAKRTTPDMYTDAHDNNAHNGADRSADRGAEEAPHAPPGTEPRTYYDDEYYDNEYYDDKWWPAPSHTPTAYERTTNASVNEPAAHWGDRADQQDSHGYATPTNAPHGYPADNALDRSTRERAPNQHRQGPLPQSQLAEEYAQDDNLLQPPSAVQSRQHQYTSQSRPPQPNIHYGAAQTSPHAAPAAGHHASPESQPRTQHDERAYAPYSAPPHPQHYPAGGDVHRSQSRPFAQPYPPPRPPESQQWSIVTGRSNDYPTSVPRHVDYTYRNVDGYEHYPGTQSPAAAPAAAPDAPEQSALPFADTMAVGTQAQQRADFLPRRTRPNIEQLQQEIMLLQERVDTTSPLGQDTVERVRRLLNKGRTILAQDVDRAVEVTYYVQQVRTILQRAEQRIRWSNAYRKRLVIYLVGWLLLALVLFTAGYLYAAELRTFLVDWMRVPVNGVLLEHFAPFYATIGAGALGSALGALVNMWRYNRKAYGFFDRKYGLLGMMLPIIGIVVGALLYLMFGTLYYLFRISPAATPILGAIPALVAFLFGCSQEKIYGTSD